MGGGGGKILLNTIQSSGFSGHVQMWSLDHVRGLLSNEFFTNLSDYVLLAEDLPFIKAHLVFLSM